MLAPVGNSSGVTGSDEMSGGAGDISHLKFVRFLSNFV